MTIFVENAVRAGWQRLDPAFRDRFAYNGDPNVPNKDMVQLVFPAIINARTVVYPESRRANKRESWGRELSGSAVADEIATLIAGAAPGIYAIETWAQRLVAKADELGRPLTAQQRRSALRWGFEASLAVAADPHVSEDEALESVLLDRVGHTIRDVNGLNRALADPEVVASVDRVNEQWSSPPIGPRFEAAEAALWKTFQETLLAAWQGEAKTEHLRMQQLWSDWVTADQVADHRHTWRSRVMGLSALNMTPGERHPPVPLGDPSSLRSEAHVLERTIYERLHGRFARGAVEGRTGFPDFPVLVRHTAERSLEPFSLAMAGSRLTLLIAVVGLGYVKDPEGATNEGHAAADVPSPFIRGVTRRMFNDSEAHRRRVGAADLSKIAEAFAKFEDVIMERLWVRLHNLETESLRHGRQGEVTTPESWGAAQDLIIEVAWKVGKALYARAVRPLAKARAVKAPLQVLRGVAGLADPEHPAESAVRPTLTPQGLLRELQATVALPRGRDFLNAFSVAQELEAAANQVDGRDLVDINHELVLQRASALRAWEDARADLAARRAIDQLPSPDLAVSQVEPLINVLSGNG